MRKNLFSRRQFLQTTAGAAGATLAANSVLLDSEPLFGADEPVAPSDRVRFGIVGVGMEGSNLVTTANLLAGKRSRSRRLSQHHHYPGKIAADHDRSIRLCGFLGERSRSPN
jgi:TAT (twin-arginine translocation) pathway signal sequence